MTCPRTRYCSRFWRENMSRHSLVPSLTEAAHLQHFQLFMAHQSRFIRLHFSMIVYLHHDTERMFMGKQTAQVFDKPTFNPTTWKCNTFQVVRTSSHEQTDESAFSTPAFSFSGVSVIKCLCCNKTLASRRLQINSTGEFLWGFFSCISCEELRIMNKFMNWFPENHNVILRHLWKLNVRLYNGWGGHDKSWFNWPAGSYTFFSLLLMYSQERHNVGDVNQKNFILKEFKTIRFMMARIVDLKY